ncbi:MAG: TetR/AcrR family transcriptional regulator [Caulobacterales bacterium]|nr:TetR/AcrR family transcriptional regulator [Caulobacterales bacterium]
MRYEKGRKDVSRRRITEIAAERFRRDGIAASGLAGIMSDAGLTNGAFYPHFRSKADLVRESLKAALDEQADQLRQALASGGLEAILSVYLSAEHRDNPGAGCASAALLPEVGRQPDETREMFAEQVAGLVAQFAQTLPPQTPDAQGVALGIYATLVGALQLARAVPSKAQSDRILAAGAEAARTLARAATEGSTAAEA